MEIHVYDIFMIVILVAATIWGGWKGMAWQIASLASIAVSYGMAVRFSPVLAPHLGAQEPWNRFLAMLILYLVSSAAIWILFQFVSKAIERVKLQEFDRQAGALIGFAKGIVLCLAITFFTVALSQDARATILQTHSGYCAAVIMDYAHDLIPDEMHALLNPYIHQLDDALPAGDRHAHQPGSQSSFGSSLPSNGQPQPLESWMRDTTKTFQQDAQQAYDQLRNELPRVVDEKEEEVLRRMMRR